MKHTLNIEENNQKIARTEEYTIHIKNKHYEEMETNLNKQYYDYYHMKSKMQC